MRDTALQHILSIVNATSVGVTTTSTSSIHVNPYATSSMSNMDDDSNLDISLSDADIDINLLRENNKFLRQNNASLEMVSINYLLHRCNTFF